MLDTTSFDNFIRSQSLVTYTNLLGISKVFKSSFIPEFES